MSLNKINYVPGDVLTSAQMNDIQDTVLANQSNFESHLEQNNPHNITPKMIGTVELDKNNKIPSRYLPDMDFAESDHTHNPEDIGAAPASHTHGASSITSGTFSSSRLPTVPVSKGGTGKTSLGAGNFLIGNGTSSVDEKTLDEVIALIGAADAIHASQHATDGDDPITPEMIGALPLIDARSEEWDMDTVLKGGAHAKLFLVNTSTKNTPYAKDVVTFQQARILSFSSGANYGMQIAFIMGRAYTYCRALNNGVISDWTSGFLPLSGGTLSGSTIHLYDAYARVIAAKNAVQLASVNDNTKTDGVRRALTLYNSGDSADGSLAAAVRVADYVADGSGKVTSTVYKLYGEHNKPTPDDLGAAAKSHTHSSTDIDGLHTLMTYGARIYSKTYTGTGTSGQNNPNKTLVLPGKPLMVWIRPIDHTDGIYIEWMRGQDGNTSDNKFEFDENTMTVSWYASSDSYQCNVEGKLYRYVVLCEK